MTLKTPSEILALREINPGEIVVPFDPAWFMLNVFVWLFIKLPIALFCILLAYVCFWGKP